MEDSGIIRLYWERDQAAIDATAEKYGPYCAAIARNILHSPRDEEEYVNDTYLHAWNAMPPQRPSLLSAFLGAITRNLSLNRLRLQQARKRSGLDAVFDELAECVSGSESAEDAVAARELAAAIDDFLAALPSRQRVLFLRRYWYADSLEGIARRCGMTKSAASMALSRQRRRLKAYLSERGFIL